MADIERGLHFSFYNSTTEKINVTAKLVANVDGVYGKIRANLDDIQLINYYLKRCLITDSRSIPQKKFPRYYVVKRGCGLYGYCEVYAEELGV
jgi:hypothetical protein